MEEDRGLRDSDLEEGLVRGLGGFGGLVRGLRAIDSRTSRCSASICLSYSAHMLHIMISILDYGQSGNQLPPEDVVEAQFLAGRPWRRLQRGGGSLWGQGGGFPQQGKTRT